MSRLSAHLLVLFLLLTNPTFSAAQETAQAEADEARDKQALELLESIAEGISSLRASENRIYLAGAAADLLWSKDEKRARALFDTVTKEMIAVIAAFYQGEQDRYNAFGMIQQQRRETIERMARHDPEMAMAFLRATRLPAAPDSSQRHRANETELELHLAGLIAAKDPARALRIARASLRKGMPYHLVYLISQIDAKDRSLGQTLHGEVIEQLKSQDLLRNHDAANAAWNLMTSYQPPQAKEETYRELLEFVAGVVLSVTPRDTASINFAQNCYNQVQSALPHFEKYAPARVPALRQWLQSVRRTQDPGTRIYQELQEVVQKGTVDDILALAGKYPPEYQTQVYQQAAWKALSSGDPNRARQIISEFVTEPAQRRQMLDQLDNQLLWNTISENKIAEARGMLTRIKTVEQRAQLLMSIAMNVANKGDKKQALELLAEARTLLDSSPQDSSKLNSRLQLAQNYSSLDPEQSVVLLESIIVQVNELVAAAVVLDGFEQRYLKDGEWMKANYNSLGNVINSLDQTLGQLARVNLEGARRLSSRLERLEIRLVAQLEIARSLLAGTPPTDRQMNRRFVRISR